MPGKGFPRRSVLEVVGKILKLDVEQVSTEFRVSLGWTHAPKMVVRSAAVWGVCVCVDRSNA